MNEWVHVHAVHTPQSSCSGEAPSGRRAQEPHTALPGRARPWPVGPASGSLRFLCGLREMRGEDVRVPGGRRGLSVPRLSRLPRLVDVVCWRPFTTPGAVLSLEAEVCRRGSCVLTPFTATKFIAPTWLPCLYVCLFLSEGTSLGCSVARQPLTGHPTACLSRKWPRGAAPSHSPEVSSEWLRPVLGADGDRLGMGLPEAACWGCWGSVHTLFPQLREPERYANFSHMQSRGRAQEPPPGRSGAVSSLAFFSASSSVFPAFRPFGIL